MDLPPPIPRQANTRIALTREIYPFTSTSKETNWGCGQSAEELGGRLLVHVVENVGGVGRGRITRKGAVVVRLLRVISVVTRRWPQHGECTDTRY